MAINAKNHLTYNHEAYIKRIFIFVICYSFLTTKFAHAEWYCDQVASEKSNQAISSCGIGESATEDGARKEALIKAYKELYMICDNSIDCKNYELIIEPLRTVCKQDSTKFKCHRGIRAEITTKKRESNSPRYLEGGDSLIRVKKQIIESWEPENIQKSVVTFSSQPSEADVEVDGVSLCQTPCTKEISYGEHALLLSKNNHFNINEKIEAKNKTHNFNYILSENIGYLEVNDAPKGAEIVIDGSVVAVVPSGTIRLRPNEYIVTIQHSSYYSDSKKIKVTFGKTEIIKFQNSGKYGATQVSTVGSDGKPVSANIYVDDTEYENSPTTIKLLIGNHTIKARNGEEEIITNLSIQEKETTKLDLTLKANKKETAPIWLSDFFIKDSPFLLGGGCLINTLPLKPIAVAPEFIRNNGTTKIFGSVGKIFFGVVGLKIGGVYYPKDSSNTLSGHLYYMSVPLYLFKQSVTIEPEVGDLSLAGSYNAGYVDGWMTKNSINIKSKYYGLWLNGIAKLPTGLDLTFGLGLRDYKTHEFLKDELGLVIKFGVEFRI